MNQILTIIKREYITRVRTKAFIITSILIPVFFSLMIFLPGYLADKSEKNTDKISLIDNTGWLNTALVQSGLRLKNLKTASPVQNKSYAGNDSVDGIIIADTRSDGSLAVQYYYKDQPSSSLTNRIEAVSEQALMGKLLFSSGVKNPAQMLMKIKQESHVSTIKMLNPGEDQQMSTVRFIVSLIGGLFIYMLIFLFGSQVMQGVLEEKTNRISEVIITSVSPVNFMMGKIIGIALLGLTQIAIWIVLGGSLLSLSACFNVLPGGISAFLNHGILQSLMQIGLAKIIICFVALFIGGYLLYSSLFAVIGVIVNHQEETQQLTMIVALPLLIALMTMLSDTIMHPDDALSVALSFIPFTSPIVMMGRLAYGVDWWQTIVSLILLVATLIVVMWLTGKIYRTMILYTGTKPGIKDIIRSLK